MITGLAGVVVVAISTCITAYQAIVMRRALNNTIDQQRAWIKVDAVPQAYISAEKGAELIIHVKASNVGSVPALSVQAGATLWPAPGPRSMNKNSPRPLRVNCPTRRTNGTAIFPGETLELFHEEPRASHSDLQYLADEEHHVQVLAVVCVTYRSGVGNEIRHTAASFAVVKRTVKFGVETDDSKVDAAHEALTPPTLQLIRLGVHDEAD